MAYQSAGVAPGAGAGAAAQARERGGGERRVLPQGHRGETCLG